MRIFLMIVGKELASFLRSTMLVIVILYSFTADIYIAGAGIQIKPKNVVVGYVDDTSGGISQKVLSHLHPPEFIAPKRYLSQKALSRAIFNKDVLVGIIFDTNFQKAYEAGKKAQINLLLDSTAASQSFTTLNYIQNILFDFEKLNIPIVLKTHKLFNQNADNHQFMALAEMLSMTTLLVVILTAMVFVKEKEEGTWDIMLLMPIDAKLIILAKSFSQVLIVMVGVIFSLGFVLFGAFHTPMNGSFWLFMLLTLVYLFSASGIGLFVAAVSKDIMQVAQLSILIMMPIIFLSGAWTPVYAMHPFFQYLSTLSPLRYYIQGSESLFFRGTGFVDMLPYFSGVFILGILLYIYGFRKIGKLF